MDIETSAGDETVYDVLSRSKDPRAARAIGRRLENFFDNKRAAAALRRMGAAAEPALIDLVPSSNADVSLYAIQLVGESGTETALTILRTASRKGSPAVRRAAKDARVKIRRRMRDLEAKAKK